MGDDRVLVRAFGLLDQVHGMGHRFPDTRRHGAHDPASLVAVLGGDGATETSDQLDLQGNRLLDFAGGWELAGAPADAAILSDIAAWRFKRGERRFSTESALARRAPAEQGAPPVASKGPDDKTPEYIADGTSADYQRRASGS